MSLPKLGTKEWKKEVEFYINSDTSQKDARARELGYKGYDSYQTLMEKRGIHIYNKNPQLEFKEAKKEDPPIFVVPKIKIREYNAPKTNGDEETMILHCGDGHAGKITKSFNKEVYRNRMDTLFDSTMIILNLHRHMYPIRKLHIINTGDSVQGENPHQGSKVGTIEMGAMDQVTKLALPKWLDLIFSFKQQFEEIQIDMFPGNHGRYSLEAPETSNWDLMLYNAIKSITDREKGIISNVHEQFSDIVDINGFKFFCFHGDDIPCQQGVPFFALDKKLKAWFIQYGGFNYALGGHFHKRHTDEVASMFEYFMVSTLVSDDEWVIKKLGISSNPSQWVYGCHPRKGVTWRYPLIVDHKFYPEKI